MIWVILGVATAAAYAIGAYFKYRLGRAALDGVPPADRVAIIDALGRCFERWRR